MVEFGVDLLKYESKLVFSFDGYFFDLVVIVCDNVKEFCLVFLEEVEMLYWFFDDLVDVIGIEDE